MLKKIATMTMFALLLNLAIAPSAFVSGNTKKEVKLAEKVKTDIAKLGTGPDANVKLKLKDGTKIQGYVKEIGDDKFVVMDSKTGQTIPVLYLKVKQVRGNNLSKGVIIAIGFGALIVLLFVLVARDKS